MTIAVFHRRLTTLVPNAVSQIVNLAQKLSEGYSQVQRYTLVRILLDSDTGTSCVDRGIQLLPRHYCTTGQIGIYSTKRLLLLIVARYTNHSILASVVDGGWRFLIHLPRCLLPAEVNGGGEIESSSPAANPHLLREEGECAAFSVQFSLRDPQQTTDPNNQQLEWRSIASSRIVPQSPSPAGVATFC